MNFRYYRPETIDPMSGMAALPDVIAWLRPGCLITTVDVANYTDMTFDAAEARLGELVAAGQLSHVGGGFWHRNETTTTEEAPPS